VLALLAAHDAYCGPLDAPPPGLNVTLDRSLHRAGTQIGPYKLIEHIGDGGMGTVWMAQQTEPVRRLVAVKLIKAGMDSAQVIARFEAERQALALMDHANIARVLDAGTTDAGRPYFVMDLVRGVPITRYCDEHHLTPRQRLELFIPVCQAIQHAHQKGIIHRDLKPSNVLVALYDGKPVPKVIDFGVAKATGQTLTDKTLVTGFGAIVGTLEYMSPEQAEVNQLDIDTRSDIYSLGVLLYELLAGSPPFSRKELEKAGMLEMLRVIREEEPSKPSTKLSTAEGLPTLAANRGTEPAKLTKLIRGELDWIVMKALEKDRNRRYETANGFAMDVQRYLADEPVQACPPSVGYRLRKFARRHKAGLAIVGLILLFVLLLGGGLGWVARDRAVRGAVLEQEVGRALEEADSWYRRDRLPVAQAAVQRAEGLLAGGGGSDELQHRVRRWRADLDMVARLEEIRLEKSAVKDLHFDSATADEDYRKAFQDYAVDVTGQEPAAAAALLGSRVIRVELAAALDDWAFVRWALAMPDGEKFLALARAIDPDPLRNQLREAMEQGRIDAVDKLTTSEQITDAPAPTLVLLASVLWSSGRTAQAVALLQRAQPAHAADFWINHQLGSFLRERKPPQLDEAIRYYNVAVALRPRSPAARLDLGVVLQDKGDLPGAIAAFQKAISLKPDFAWAYSNLASSLRDKGDLPGAIAACQKALALKPDMAEAHCNFGLALRDKGDLPGAIAAYQKALALKPDLANAHSNFGSALREQGDLAGAIVAFQMAIALKPDCAGYYYNLGLALFQKRDLPGAVGAYEKAIALDPNYAEAYTDLGVALRDKGDPPGTIAAFQKAIALKADYVPAHINLGVALRDNGDLPGAIAAFQKGVALKPDLAAAHNNLGGALQAKGDLAGAIAAYQKAIALQPDLAEAHCNFGLALRDKGDLAGAIVAFQKAIALKPDFAGAHSCLAGALQAKGDLAGAIATHQKAIALRPDYAEAHCNFGVALQDKGDLAEAIVAFQKAIALKPDFAVAYNNLGSAFWQQGQFADALAALRRGHELGAKDPNWRFPSAKWITQCERLIELEGRLPQVLKKELDPPAAERIEYAQVAVFKRRFIAAARLYHEALADQPELSFHRYDAACAAVRAGCGSGDDADPLDDKERARWRAQALDWLQADNARLASLLTTNPTPATRTAVRSDLVRRQREAHLAGVREAAALAALPAAEREAWQEFWAEIEALLRAARPDEP
jgi:tetratricopeptide (TPR) repeat protein/serine/threonine protein kinase